MHVHLYFTYRHNLVENPLYLDASTIISDCEDEGEIIFNENAENV